MTAADQDQPDGSTPPPGDGAPGAERSGYGQTPRENEVSLLDILLILARNKTLIVRTVLVFTLLGLTYTLLASEKYTSSAKVVREAQQESGGLPSGIPSGALSGLGISLGGASSGLTPAAYPDVLQSREVRLAVVRDTFHFPDPDQPMTYVEYVNRPGGPMSMVLDYTIWLPWTFKRMLGQAISESPVPAGTTKTGVPVIPSEEEEKALKVISEKVSASVSEETGLMRVSVTAGGPVLAADLAQSFIKHLQTRVRKIRTEKVRERLAFVKKRFNEAEQELETEEERLAQFLERNQNPTTATLQFQRDRLQRQVSFKEQLYSKLQSQLTQTRLDLQRRQPVATVVEAPTPPLERSAPQRTLIVLISIVLGTALALGVAFIKSFLQRQTDHPEEREKAQEVRKKLISDRLQTAYEKLSAGATDR